MCNSRYAAMARTNIILPTISRGVGDRATTSFAMRTSIVGLQFVVSGEYKDVDRFRGKKAEDTGITSVAVGPRIVASLGKVSAELGADLPVLIDNTALQVVPDYRIRGGIAIRF